MTARIYTYAIMNAAESGNALDRRFPEPDYALDREVEVPPHALLLHVWCEHGAIFGHFAVDIERGEPERPRQFRLVYTGGAFPTPPRWMYRGTVTVAPVPARERDTRTVHVFERWGHAPAEPEERAA